MKQHALSKATLILSVFWFLLPLHSWAQSQQYILLPFIFPPTATMQATNAKTPVEIVTGYGSRAVRSELYRLRSP